jgi:uncharacterized membrane protein
MSEGGLVSTQYERVAGRSLERVTALSDGVFAVAMTLLMLDLSVPAVEGVHSDADLWVALVKIAPSALAYFMSFLTLGIFWVGQQAQLDLFKRSDRNLTWLNFGFLFLVSLMPFSTKLLAAYHTDEYHIALILYWLNILLLGVTLYAGRWYVSRAGLWKDDVTPEIMRAGYRRIAQAQAFYLICLLLSFFSTTLSIMAFILVQANYAVLPWIRVLYRGMYRLLRREPDVDVE